jgi:hypothetical protein
MQVTPEPHADWLVAVGEKAETILVARIANRGCCQEQKHVDAVLSASAWIMMLDDKQVVPLRNCPISAMLESSNAFLGRARGSSPLAPRARVHVVSAVRQQHPE